MISGRNWASEKLTATTAETRALAVAAACSTRFMSIVSSARMCRIVANSSSSLAPK